jgi:signal transduction histidine kinase
MAGSPVSVYGEACYGLFVVDSRQPLSSDDFRNVIELAERIGFLIERSFLREETIRGQRYITTGVFYEFMRHDIVPILSSLSSFDIVKLWESMKSDLMRVDQTGDAARTKFRNRLAAINDAIRDVSTLFENFTSLEKGESATSLINIDKGIPEIIDTIKKTMVPSTGIQIIFQNNVPEGCPPTLVSGVKFTQILKNLVLNACQQIRLHSLPVKKVAVSLNYESSDTKLPVKITVLDTGPGVHRVDFEKVFMPLYTTRKKGIGLGLFLCRQLATEIGGKVEIKSSYMLTGSEFQISLPGEVEA